MCNPIFDYDDGDFIYQTSSNMGIDSDGDLHMRMGDNMSMDMDTGELHFNSGWKNDDDDDGHPDLFPHISSIWPPLCRGRPYTSLFYPRRSFPVNRKHFRSTGYGSL